MTQRTESNTENWLDGKKQDGGVRRFIAMLLKQKVSCQQCMP